ncbi:hypothetical protein BaRGS_00024345 [Batillaria attramentaria]|uniref:Uncharacterized protein n=1 Tax=Batillaria attramentaria TaxID=370345 RepID=A0ABD0KBT8_9CAEN
MALYPNNTLSSYTTKLDPPIDLRGHYEVGLVDIVFPRSWLNIKPAAMWLNIRKRESANQPVFIEHTVRLPAGHYDSVAHLITMINHEIPKTFKTDQAPPIPNIPKVQWQDMFYYKKELGKVILTLGPGIMLIMSPDLTQLLGFKARHHSGEKHVFAEHVANVNQAVGCLYVYLSIIEDRIVGDTRAPLLRMVPLTGYRGEVAFHSFHNVQFIPIKFNSFDHIEVNIRNGKGELIPFEQGEVILTLQLRRRIP